MYELLLGESLGDIKIGMKRENVKNILGNYESWIETPYGYDHEVKYDRNDDFMISYDMDGVVNYINCYNIEKIAYRGKSLSSYTYRELLSIISELDSSIEKDEYGFISDTLGFGVCIEFNDEDEAYIDNIQVVKKGFWMEDKIMSNQGIEEKD